MATPGVVGDVWEVTVEGRQEGQQVLNILHFQVAVGFSSIELQLLDALIACLVALIPKMASNYTFTGLKAKTVMPVLGPIIERQATGAQATAGIATGDPSPSFVSALVSIRTVRGGRSGRGRIFLPGVPETALVGSTIMPTDPYYVAILAFIACVTGKFIQTGETLNAGQLLHLGVVSRKIGGAKPPYTGDAFARATLLKPSNLVSHNVSRKVGRGS